MVEKTNRLSFERMLRDVLREYRKKGSISEKGVIANDLLAAMTRGVRTFGMKLVKQENGMPGVRIFADGMEYSALEKELSPRAVITEYLKAWFTAELLAREFGICDAEDLCFAMEVDEEAVVIPSQVVSDFVSSRENPSNTRAWKNCRKVALDHLDWFERVDAIMIYGVLPVRKIA
ncbi:MAG: hypothetical protein Q4F79_09205 [Eubacteriales bacterium]|nr:hypothetical protein [Eubacteriales bacterium]